LRGKTSQTSQDLGFPGILRKSQPALNYLYGDGGEIFLHACKLGCEGIVSKRAGSPYVSGRIEHWLKMKNPNAPAILGSGGFLILLHLVGIAGKHVCPPLLGILAQRSQCCLVGIICASSQAGLARGAS
jgi:hypothetical protein